MRPGFRYTWKRVNVLRVRDFLEPALKSVKEIEDAFECVVAMGKTQSVPTLVVGKLGPSTTIIEPLLELRDTEGSEIQVSLKNKRGWYSKPKI